MTIRAVDMQIVVQKSAETMRAVEQEHSKNRLHMQQQAQILQQKTQAENRQIKNTQKTEKNIIHDNGEEKGNKGNRKHKNRKNKEKMTEAKKLSSTIDIKI